MSAMLPSAENIVNCEHPFFALHFLVLDVKKKDRFFQSKTGDDVDVSGG